MRDMILAIRADEACHREVNHHFSDVPSWEEIDSSHFELSDSKVDDKFSKDQKEIEKKN